MAQENLTWGAPRVHGELLKLGHVVAERTVSRYLARIWPEHPTAQWLAQQVVNAFPWDTAPRFVIRGRDRTYGLAFPARVRGLGIREIRTAIRALG
jgi:hypothetical protein